MKPLFIIIFSLLFSANFHAQKEETTDVKNSTLIEFFNQDYKKKNYKKFTGNIVFKGNTVLFDDKIVYFDKSDKITSAILKEGLIYPQLLTDFQMQKFINESTDKSQKRFLKLQKNPRSNFDVNNIKLSNISEINFQSLDSKTKRFKITLKNIRLNSTSIYLFELVNKNASKDDKLEDFIKNSKLTYIGVK